MRSKIGEPVVLIGAQSQKKQKLNRRNHGEAGSLRAERSNLVPPIRGAARLAMTTLFLSVLRRASASSAGKRYSLISRPLVPDAAVLYGHPGDQRSSAVTVLPSLSVRSTLPLRRSISAISALAPGFSVPTVPS